MNGAKETVRILRGSPQAYLLSKPRMLNFINSIENFRARKPDSLSSWPKAPPAAAVEISPVIKLNSQTQAEHPNKLGAYPKLISRKSYF